MTFLNSMISTALLAVAASVTAATQAAAAWPERPVKLLVPFAPGGLTDVTARLTAERLRAKFQQPFVVENEPGATGTLAAQRVAKADPDGYTLFFCATNQIAIAPFTHNISYDPQKDFKAAGLIATTPFVIAVSDALPAKTLAELVTYAKSSPKGVTYGSSGVGSLSHLASAALSKAIGVNMVHVPYRGVAPAFQDLLAGHVEMVAVSPVELKPQLATGKIRALAVVDTRKSPALPDVPIVGDTIPGLAAVNWSGIMAPSATPRAIVDALAQEIVVMHGDKEFSAQLQKIGVDPGTGSAAEFEARIAADMERWRVIVEDLGIGKSAPRKQTQ